MQVEMRPIDSIRPYGKNPRVNDGAVDAVVASIREFGWRQPIVVDGEGVIVVGHTRYKGAKKMGLTELPVHVATDLTPAQARAYRIADNATAQLAEWDKLLLPAELTELQADGIDLGLLGFDDEELSRWLSADDDATGRSDADEVPPVPENPVTRPGDLWLLDQHRLLCGDSTNVSDVTKLLDGNVPFLMVTDPPYGVEYHASWRHAAGLNSSDRVGEVPNDHRYDWTDAYKLFPGTVAYLWHAGVFSGPVASHLEAAGFEIRAQIIWRKPRFVISRGHYHWSHEPCWYAVRPGRTGGSKWCGDRSQSTVWDIAQKDDGTGQTFHSTQKPVECMSRPIRHHGGKGDDVYDPFGGSGTTLIAAEQRGRRCFMMELERLVANMRTYSRIPALNRYPERMADVVNQALRDLGSSAGIPVIDVSQELFVLVDRNLISIAIANVVKNAFEALNAEPLQAVRIQAQSDGSFARLIVGDNGCGIVADDLLTLRDFVPGRTSKKNAGGTGWGLAIANRYVEAHGGRIRIESQQGEGSVVTIELPLVVPEGEADEP